MNLAIKNMVCRNCVSSLAQLLRELGISAAEVGLGFARIDADRLDDDTLSKLDVGLQRLGFERIVAPEYQLVEKVKHEIFSHINRDEPCPLNLSQCIAHATGEDYKAVSRVFSAVEGRTVEKFYVTAKIEKAKELLSYGELTLSEIAYRLGYSSVAFLSRQFKQETGMSPTQFQASDRHRRALNEL